MLKALKWAAIVLGVLIILLAAAVVIIPSIVDVQKYKPDIERQVAELTGRPFALGGDMDLSIFPWVGVALSDIHLGNPEGFEQGDFISIKSFEARVKLLPLLFKDIQVKRFVMREPRAVLVRDKAGRGNWEGLGKTGTKSRPEKQKKPKEGRPSETPALKSLTVGEFAITGGSVLWIDHTKDQRGELRDIDLKLRDVSLDKPVKLSLFARLDGNPLELSGKIGPLGREPGKGTIPLDLWLEAFEQLDIRLRGTVVDPSRAADARFDLAVDIPPFSPRQIFKALGRDFPANTADPRALEHLALSARIRGTIGDAAIPEGKLRLDDSTLTFSMEMRDGSKPHARDIRFRADLDQMDLDRYLPPQAEQPPPESPKAKPSDKKKRKTDYEPLRRLTVDGTLHMGKLTVKRARLEDVRIKIAGKDGLFRLEPLSLKAYSGSVAAEGTFDFRDETPKSRLKLHVEELKARPLINDVMEKDFLEGNMQAQISLRIKGDRPGRIRRTLNGDGELVFNDGAIIGIDLAGMVRNVKTTFGLEKRRAKRPRTDFSELRSPFTIQNGTLKTDETTLASPLLRVRAEGSADLVRERLDFRVEPKFVGTLKGQGDVMQRSGITVPVLVGGTFSSPSFRPDLARMIRGGVVEKLPAPSALEEALTGKKAKGKRAGRRRKKAGGSEALENTAKDLLKKAFPLKK